MAVKARPTRPDVRSPDVVLQHFRRTYVSRLKPSLGSRSTDHQDKTRRDKEMTKLTKKQDDGSKPPGFVPGEHPVLPGWF